MHFNDLRWTGLVDAIDRLFVQRACHPARCIVLVPYVQLVPIVRQVWLERAHSGQAVFLPRIETTQSWAEALWARQGGYAPSPDDFTGHPAIDQIAAWRWLDGAGLSVHRQDLSLALRDAAQSIARLAASIEPAQRAPWASNVRGALTQGMDTPALRLEASLAQIALAWVSATTYISDVLFEQTPELLIVIEGWHVDPLAQSLLCARGDRAVRLPWAEASGNAGRIALHACQDREEEAVRAAACVLAHLAQGRQPVALIAQDRELTRRISALLATREVRIRDETGWTLSTTRAAASVMALLRAARWRASCDEVLVWLKQIPLIDPAVLLDAEVQLRKGRVRRWSELGVQQSAALALQAQVGHILQNLRSARPLERWLLDLRQSLRDCCMWDDLCADAAGQTVIRTLRLQDDLLFSQAPNLSLQAFTDWAAQCLESATFTPDQPLQAQVLVLPLGQLLGRSPAAVVLPGADERHLPACPNAPGPWTARQRQLLGLPSRDERAAAQRKAWQHLLQYDRVDVLWRGSEKGEPLMAATFVQELRLAGRPADSPDPRGQRLMKATPVTAALADGRALPIEKLSASAYEDLRACPYRFFALRLLGLAPSEELDGRLDARDLGLWLHAALRYFHESQSQGTGSIDAVQRIEALDGAAQRALEEAGLDPVELLPHQAAWPVLRDAYLNWLDAHEAQGHRFEAAEAWHQVPFEGLELVGKIDRIDRNAQGQPLLMDYKTERKEKIRARIKRPTEDTQLAFYAALRPEEALSAMYLGLGDRGSLTPMLQPQIGQLRDLLLDGLRQDLSRLRAGEPLRALGQGQSCQYCQARGLCRRDFAQGEPS